MVSGHTTNGNAPKYPQKVLCLTALGVVYGDIGTSPLYALRECFSGTHPVAINSDNIMGVLSLIFWSLILIVTVKYHVYVLKADNRGEGGILALMALVHQARPDLKRSVILGAIGLFGAALLYGDGIITPAISVLSAVEGLRVATPGFSPYVVPITIAILVILFMFQRKGTARVGAVFGTVLLFWFLTLAFLGLRSIFAHPEVLKAVNPLYAVHFFQNNGIHGYLVLGAVFLVATGGEALYADLGHFGELPIQIDWFSFVLPSLLLNYFGQGALLLSHPEFAKNPFYYLVPGWGLYPLVVLATMATIIASQAVISGVFSLTRQAVQLGYAPRVSIIHTSEYEIGQIYIPGANWALMLCTIALVLGFQSSSNLAAAYGVAVTMTMIITTFLAYFVSRYLWHWKRPVALLVTGTFLIADTAFFGANIFKITHGGWLPIVLGVAVFLLFTTWRTGRELVAQKVRQSVLPLTNFLADVARSKVARVPGTAIFLNSEPDGTPIAMLHNIKHNRVLHEKNVTVTIVTDEVPRIRRKDRVQWKELGQGFCSIEIHYGFMEDPDVPYELSKIKKDGFEIDPAAATYILSRNTLLTTKAPGMALWRKKLFVFMSRNASQPTEFFRLPPNRVIELGMQIEI